MTELTPAEMDRQIQELTRRAMEDDQRWRRSQARYEAHNRLMNAHIALTVEVYAQAIGSMWAMALNPNLKGEGQ
jgi:uncharacterized protein (DUF488 family)